MLNLEGGSQKITGETHEITDDDAEFIDDDPWSVVPKTFWPAQGCRAAAYGLSQYAWDVLFFLGAPPILFNTLYLKKPSSENTPPFFEAGPIWVRPPKKAECFLNLLLSLLAYRSPQA